MLTTAPDMRVTIEDLFAAEDKVAVRWTFRGTHTGPSLIRDAPTGKPLTVVAIEIYRFANGKIEEDWGVEAQWQTGEVWK
jgi:predicted ester cyclase